jgi:fructose-1-phosphate kinase PfkB-like protein
MVGDASDEEANVILKDEEKAVSIAPNEPGYNLTEQQRKDVLNQIDRLEWSRDDPDTVSLYFKHLGEPFIASEFVPGSYTRGILEALQEFIAGLLDLPNEEGAERGGNRNR